MVAARRASVPYVIEANGVVTPMQSVSVTPQVDGIILSVDFQEGDEVRAGQPLFHIDSRPYQNAYDQAVAVLARDSANVRARAGRGGSVPQAARTARDHAAGSRRSDHDRATSEATVRADRAAVANAKFNLDNTVIRAPISGKTGSLLVKRGNLVRSGGGAPLVVINQVRPIYVRFAVPSSQLPLVLQYGAKGGLPVAAVPGGIAAADAVDRFARRGERWRSRRMRWASRRMVATVAAAVAAAVVAADAAMAMLEVVPVGRRTRRATAERVDAAVGRGPGAGGSAAQTARSRRGSGAAGHDGRRIDGGQAVVHRQRGRHHDRHGAAQGDVRQLDRSPVGGTVRHDLAPSLRSRTTRSSCRTQAIVTGQRGSYVYVVDQADTARQRAVVVERTAGGLADHRERHSRRRSCGDGRTVAPHAGRARAPSRRGRRERPRRAVDGGGGAEGRRRRREARRQAAARGSGGGRHEPHRASSSGARS